MDKKIKLAIIGASYLQEPLIQKAKERGIETHVFAWAAGDVGEKSADYFYPISIIDKEEILAKCQEIGIDGICSIASDLAVITVNYVAEKMGLIANPNECVMNATNKHNMRLCFAAHNCPSPKSIQIHSMADLDGIELAYPVIVKPVDRSGSRGITKLNSRVGLEEAVVRAIDYGFEKVALIEEYAVGQEYSVEYISWEGQHHFLAMTKKYTTGEPNFIEMGHIEPAPVSESTLAQVKQVVEKALDSLGVKYGASHSELKISEDGEIKLIEIGARMGGDFIGSSLVELSTGYDFVGGVIDVALGIEPRVNRIKSSIAAIRFIFNEEDVKAFELLKAEHPEMIIASDINEVTDEVPVDSSSRFGYYLYSGKELTMIKKYLPKEVEEKTIHKL